MTRERSGRTDGASWTVHAWVAPLVVAPFVAGLLLGAEPGEQRRVVATFTDPEIVEASGLLARAGLLATVNDSGDVGRTFVVEPDTGRTVGHASWGAAQDVEALAPLEQDALVGDIGDNGAERAEISVLRVPVRRGDASLDTAAAVRLVYPDGPRDAEALLVDPVSGRVLVVSKVLLGGTIYEVPRIAVPPRVGAPAPVEPVRMVPLGSAPGLVTDGAFFPDGRHLVLRDYDSATVYTWPDLQVAGTVDLPEQPQGEGIAVREIDGGYEVLISSEGQRSEVLRARLPSALAEAVAPTGPGGAAGEPGAAEPGADADPAADPATSAAEQPEPTRPLAPWLLGGVLMLAAVALLLRSLRPR